MADKPNPRNWKDVQTVIASVAIVTTLGMWELVATPARTEAVVTLEPVVPPTDPSLAAEPTGMPKVKIMFTPATATNNTTLAQQPQVTQKKKKNHNGGGGSVTQTHTS